MSSVTFYKQRTKLGSMDASMMARLKELEEKAIDSRKCTLKSTKMLIFSKRPSQKW